MSKVKYHINPETGRPNQCTATVRDCKYAVNGELPAHYDTKAEAKQAVEKLLSETHGVTNTLTKKAKRKTSKPKLYKNDDVDNSNSVKHIKNMIDNLYDNRMQQKFGFPSTDELEEIGKEFDKEVIRRTGIDFYNNVLTDDDVLKIEEENHRLLDGIVDTGGDLVQSVQGSLAKDLNRAVKVLPNSVKESLSSVPIMTKKVRKDNTSFDGQHHIGKFDFTTTDNITKTLYDVDVPVGAVHTKNYIAPGDWDSPYYGSAGVMNVSGDDDTYEKVWFGYRLASACGRKIADGFDYYDDRTKTTHYVNNPVYALKVKVSRTGSIISTKHTYDKKYNSSVLLHEYTHLVQSKDNSTSEMMMFKKIAGEEKVSNSFYPPLKVRKGFPDEYMGLTNGRELLTRASEGFYYPSASNNHFLYGKDRGENADKVRSWVIGYWIAKSHYQTKEKITNKNNDNNIR